MVVTSLPSLSSASDYYSQAFSIFNQCSDQKIASKNWYSKKLPDIVGKSEHLAVLSIGCGNGDVDAYLITELLIPNCVSLIYHGIEPNRSHRDKFLNKLLSHNSKAQRKSPLVIHDIPVEGCSYKDNEVLLFDCSFEALTSLGESWSQRYDVIIAGHSLYFVKDLLKSLDVMLKQLVVPNGCILITHTTPADFQCSEEVVKINGSSPLHHVQIMQEICNVLESNPHFNGTSVSELYSNQCIIQPQVNDLFVDVSECLTSENKNPELEIGLMSFLFGIDFRSAEPVVLERMRAILRRQSINLQNSKWVLWQPEAVIAVNISRHNIF
ncbi:hypothetical protein K7432_007962 [Basidiobolus ranarum]|uniref:Methyltransferase domain-containing protein n=1 Tax=Basidiobolus ranarum TaxID=34480 RepID=A0ABR2WSN8_9FUNG